MINVVCDLDLDEWMYKVPNDVRSLLCDKFPNVKFTYDKDPGVEKILNSDIYWGNRLKKLASERLKSHRLSWIHFGSVGYERIFKSNLNLKKILVSNSFNTMDTGIVNHGLYLIFSLLRSGYGIDKIRKIKSLNRENFEKFSHNIKNIEDLKILILGLGRIGKKLATKLNKLGAKVDGVKKNTPIKKLSFVENIYKFEDIYNFIHNYDLVISLLPYDENLNEIYDKKFFDSMQKNSFFINMGRGIHLNEKDFVEALKTKLAGGAIDVFRMEPLDTKSGLYDIENLILTPHVAAYDPNYWECQYQLFQHNLICFLSKNYNNMKNIVITEE